MNRCIWVLLWVAACSGGVEGNSETQSKIDGSGAFAGFDVKGSGVANLGSTAGSGSAGSGALQVDQAGSMVETAGSASVEPEAGSGSAGAGAAGTDASAGTGAAGADAAGTGSMDDAGVPSGFDHSLFMGTWSEWTEDQMPTEGCDPADFSIDKAYIGQFTFTCLTNIGTELPGCPGKVTENDPEVSIEGRHFDHWDGDEWVGTGTYGREVRFWLLDEDHMFGVEFAPDWGKCSPVWKLVRQ